MEVAKAKEGGAVKLNLAEDDVEFWLLSYY